MGKRETGDWIRSVAELERSDIPIPEMYLLRNPIRNGTQWNSAKRKRKTG